MLSITLISNTELTEEALPKRIYLGTCRPKKNPPNFFKSKTHRMGCSFGSLQFFLKLFNELQLAAQLLLKSAALCLG